MVVLTVGVETGGWAERGIGCGRACITEAAAAEMSRIVAGVENPSELHIGTNSTASTGTVPNEVPMPIVTSRPMSVMTTAATALLPPTAEIPAFTSASMPPVALMTEA